MKYERYAIQHCIATKFLDLTSLDLLQIFADPIQLDAFD